jgi:hypothetical protein
LAEFQNEQCTLWDSFTQESFDVCSGPESTVINLMAVAAPAELPTKILYDRKCAAYALSISVRSLDYLIANKRLNTSKLG